MGHGAPSGTVTFLFTDIEGSTSLWQQDEVAMRGALSRHDELLREVIAEHGGVVFSTMGDGMAAAFSSASSTVAAALTAQQLLDVEAWPTATPIRVRMGLHTGEAELRDGDYFGTAVNRAARLMAAGHGGQVLVSAITAGVVSSSALVDLGVHRLRDLAEAQQVFQLGDGAFPALRSLNTALTNLAVQPTPLVGRQVLIADLSDVVEREPVVTLSGVGGVGKTRLALEIGAELLPRFPDGVWVVELAPVAHDDLVLPTIAEVLGVAAQTGEPLATTIVSRLKSKRLLVIMDNCEHVLSPVASLVERLAASAPGVRVLATSREPLGIGAERVRAVPPLGEATEAVELFVERAAQAGAVVDDGQMTAIAEICVRLDGIPLAIELAAARARMMAPTQIAERLDQRFRLLTGGGRTAVERHRTLQATVAWSYELLDETERTVFQRLSTLARTFDLDAAEAIATGGMVEGFEVLDALGHLVDKSMVLAVAGTGSVRYRLLETLRQFGAERLAEQPDANEVHDRHAFYWRDRAVELGRATGLTAQAAGFDGIDIDIDNYRTGFAHLLGTGRVNEAARGILALAVYWQIRRTREGLRWNQQLLTYPDLDPHRRLRALGHAAEAESSTGDIFAAERYGTEAVERADAVGVDPPWGALHALMLVALDRHDPDTHRWWYERVHRVAEASGQRYLQLLIEANRYGGLNGGATAEEVARYERLLPEVRQYGDPLLVCMCGWSFASVLYEAGQVERACETAGAAIDTGRRAGPVAIASALGLAGAVYGLSGQGDRARAPATEALRIARDEGFTVEALHSIFVAAALAARRHEIEATAVVLAGASRHADALGIGPQGLFYRCRVEAQTAVDAYRGDLSAAHHLGAQMTLGDLTNYALESLGEHESTVGEGSAISGMTD